MIEKYDNYLAANNIVWQPKNKNIIKHKADYIAKLVRNNNFKNILEIGRHKGYSYGLFRYFSPKSLIVSIDIVHYKEADKIALLFKDNNYIFIDGDSSKLKEHKLKYDLVLIDGDHSYEGCKTDWKNIQNYLTSDAVIIFDDVVENTPGCNRLFEEIKVNKKRPVSHLGIVRL